MILSFIIFYNVNYTSPKIQNEILALCSQTLKNIIISEIKDTGFFSIVCDDAR